MSRQILSCILLVCFLSTACPEIGSAAEAVVTVSEPTVEALQTSLTSIAKRRKNADSSPVIVRLPPGQYRLNEPLVLSPSIIGDGLTLQALQNGGVVLSGAVKLDSARRVDGHWRFALPPSEPDDATPTIRPRVVLIDGTLRSAARHPNVGYARIVATAADRRSGFEFDAKDLPSDFELADQPCDVVFLHDWSSSRLPIRAIDRQQTRLTTVGPIGCSAAHYAIDHFEKQPRYWLEGHPALADAAGEWFVDTVANDLVLVAGSEEHAPTVELPVLESLLVASGDDSVALTGLRLEGLVFTGTKFPMPAGGLAGAQATMHEPRSADGSRMTSHRPMLTAAVLLERARDCQVTGCAFRGLGNTALWIGGQTVSCTVEKSTFEDIGGNAINLGEDSGRRVNGKVWYQAAPKQVPTSNRVVDCQIRRCGAMLPGSVAIWAALHHRLEVANNVIEDCPYTGISLGWIWDDRQTPAGNNHVHHNQIRHVMQVLSDGGGIYTLGRQPNSRLEANTISNVPLNAGRAESNGMFLDQGSTGFTISENEFRRIAKSPLRFHQAGANKVAQNRWELETENTPAVRYNNTPQANIVLQANTALEREQRIFLIGNSLTWDTRPPLLSGYVNWHVDCGKSLQFIHDHPANPCVDSSRLWPLALQQLQYDYLAMQPHYGTTLTQDISVISKWMKMQPDAIVVIHTGWARSATAAEEYASDATEQMSHNAKYFAALIAALREKYPQREIRQTAATQTLHQVAVDIEAGKAPLANLTDLYRDAIHMTHAEGRYLMHNLMRQAVDQEPSSDGFPIESSSPKLKAYLDSLLELDR